MTVFSSGVRRYGVSGLVLIDPRINEDTHAFLVAYSNHGTIGTATRVSGDVRIHNREGRVTTGWSRRLLIANLAPTEIPVHVGEQKVA